MLWLLSLLEHGPQPEIHQVPQDHCSDRNPELSHFNANLLRLVALRPHPTADEQPIAPAAEILPQLFPVSESHPANVSRTETMAGDRLLHNSEYGRRTTANVPFRPHAGRAIFIRKPK